MNRKERRAAAKTGGHPSDVAAQRARVNALLSDAASLHAAGQWREALPRLQQVIAIAPDFLPAYAALGTLLCQGGQFSEAVGIYRRALALDPDNAVIHNNLGNALAELGRFDQATASYQRALALNPAYPEAHNNLGNCHSAGRAFDAAAACYRRAVELKPDYAIAYNNLGAALREQGALDEAIASFTRAIALAPQDAEAHTNLGMALRERGELARAVDAYRAALTAEPNYVEAYNNLGVVMHDLGRLDHALEAYRRALALNPKLPETLSNLGITLRQQGLLSEAIAAQRQALVLQPGRAVAEAELIYTQSLACDWSETDTAPARLVAARQQGAVPPFFMLAQPVTPAEHLACACQWVAASLGRAGARPDAPRSPRSRQPSRGRKLRIAYLSADFYNHPVAHAIAGLFEAHDGSRFETIGFSYAGQDDEMRSRLKNSFGRFVDIQNTSNNDVVELLQELDISIVVDLTGHTRGSRSLILAARPVPIQVSYFGYSGTMGADFIDYLLADRFIVPENEMIHYSEQVVYLPDTFLPTTRRQIARLNLTRTAVGLPEDRFVFCSFSNTYKINPPVFDVWMRLLKQVDGSVLWLLDANALAAENLRREAAKRGVAPERLVFAQRVPFEDHLARHSLADLMLDTLPYNAHTTAADAFWTGLPVVTCWGTTFAGRVAGSALLAAGLPELVAQNLDEYEALALTLALNRDRLAALKRKLARHRETSPLFDTTRLCRHIELAYQIMWERYQRDEPPASFAIAPLGAGLE
jgi:protein O-GlcNAc transferase